MAWGAIIPAAISVLGMMFGNKGGGNQQQQMQNLMTPEMRELLQMQIQRMRGQEPLYQDVMGMARGLLPTRYRGMGARPGMAQPTTGTDPGIAYNPNPKPGDYEGPNPKPGPSRRWTPPGY